MMTAQQVSVLKQWSYLSTLHVTYCHVCHRVYTNGQSTCANNHVPALNFCV